ncbi:LamG domain-containing protein [Thalassomonas viridans]|uniref:LamG domain-containing protein n=1 Tax=Thalassomonas viridans TaxID=137584 RepID=A0AAE9Z5W0_9GAMM|nr:LamG domain-containing protein [Thalassomonas viridans]WDE06654.1 LamG domain-containing protein [Thalassomonas viridans]
MYKKLLFPVVATLSLVSPHSLAEAELLAHFELNGNTKDASGNLPDGQIVGNVTAVPDRCNNPNGAMYLDGNNSYIKVADGNFLTPRKASTVCLRANVLEPYRINKNHVLLSKYRADSSYETGYTVMVDRYDKLRIWSKGKNLTELSDYPEMLDFNDYGNWNHICLVDNKTNITTYVNGYPYSVKTSPDSVYADTSIPLLIGASYSGNGQPSIHSFATAYIDDVRVYSTPLTSNQVKRIAFEACPSPAL